MALLTVNICGRPYEIGCEEGQEDHVTQLARDVDRRAQGVLKAVGAVGDGRLLLMVCLTIADELREVSTRFLAARGAPLTVPVLMPMGLADQAAETAAIAAVAPTANTTPAEDAAPDEDGLPDEDILPDEDAGDEDEIEADELDADVVEDGAETITLTAAEIEALLAETRAEALASFAGLDGTMAIGIEALAARIEVIAERLARA